METSIRQHYELSVKQEMDQMERFKAQAEKRNNAENVQRYEKKINDLKKELELDTSIAYEEFAEKQRDILKKKNEKQDDSKQKSDQFYDLENQDRRAERSLKHQMKRQWEWLCQQDQHLPSYIRTNLDKMPNNKGYIWKGIWYFGHLPEDDPNLSIMFEKLGNGQDMRIHEIRRNTYYKIFQRNKNGQNILISEKILRER